MAHTNSHEYSPHPLFDFENFNFKELRQKILNYVIQSDDKVLPNQVVKCRLVCSDWLLNTTGALRASKKHLFNLTLNQDHFIAKSRYFNIKQRNVVLDLEQTFGQSYPPIALNVSEYYTKSENGSKLGNVLRQTKDYLVSLDMNINPGFSYQMFLQNLCLPVVEKLSFALTDFKEVHDYEYRLLQMVGFILTDKCDSEPLLQHILNICPKLQQLVFPTGSHLIFLNFSNINLPETLTSLEVSAYMEPKNLEVLLTKNSLPKLIRLTVIMPENPISISPVLENFKDSLKFIKIIDRSKTKPNLGYFQFPVMLRLEEIMLESKHNIQLEQEIPCLNTYLPKLTKLCLWQHSPDMINKWVNKNSRFELLTRFHVTLNEDLSYLDKIDFKTITEDIASTFPNIKDFMFDFHGMNIDAVLGTVFKVMKKLEKLHVCASCPKKSDQDLWTSILLGSDSGSLSESNSITSLSELTTLIVVQTAGGKSLDAKTYTQLLSESVFEMALLQMPKLKNLTLEEPYWVSEENIQRWKSSGRRIDFFRTSA